jgi:CheY-like chemotaxis protein
MLQRKCQSILCVDDDPDICEVVQATLRLVAGLDVNTACSGERAIDLAYELRPDLILMDVMMPGLDGPATLKRIRNSALIKDIPVIFLTAKVLPAEIAHFLQLGAIGVIRKPFDPIKLGDELHALWERRDSVREVIGKPSAERQVQTHVNSLAEGFLQRTRGDAVRLNEMSLRVRAGDRSTLKDVERLAHSIRGAAAMFGFPQLSAAGEAIEEVAVKASANHSVSDSATDPDLQELMHCIERLANDVGAAQQMPSDGDSRHRRFAGR